MTHRDDRGLERLGAGAAWRGPAVLVLALVAGTAARLVLAFEKPVWADEVYTLGLARKSLADLLASLRVDSGPPLHYLAAKLLLLPFPLPGAADVLVRLLSVAASLLHVPVLLRIGRRRGAPGAGLAAAALFLVLPLAVASGAEGRGYALASLLALASFERVLALEDSPRPRTAIAAGLLAGAAVLTHYLALLPAAGALLAAFASSRRRGPVILAGGVAAAVAGAWLPVALGQPRASMAWALAQPLGERALQVLTNLGFGLAVEPAPARVGGSLALLLLAAALLLRRGRARVPAAAPLLLGLALLVPLVLLSRSALLPERTALVFLPLVALVLSEAGRVLQIATGVAAALVLGVSFQGWLQPTPAARLAGTLAPRVRAGARVVAAELWGPELDYRLARMGLAGRVTYFPSEVARHPGWYDPTGVDGALLSAEAGALARAATGETFFVFSAGSPAGAALLGVLPRARARPVASAGVFEIWMLPRQRAADGRPGPTRGN